MESSDPKKYVFPRIKRVQLHAFSLYSLRPDVSISLNDGVLCLAGANGIGKSTFLATVNYGLTGAVPHPRRRLLSTQQYLKEASAYSVTFFDGRIEEHDRESAAITLELKVGETDILLTRGLFDPTDVRRLEISGGTEAPINGADLTPSQRDAMYREKIPQLIDLTSFEQFVFLQHFVFTFDEARHLLFWDEAATVQTLFLCFGGDPQDAARADHLNREAERAGSRGRNAQFQVNNTRKRIDVIEQSIAPSPHIPENIEDLDDKYQELAMRVDEALKKSETADAMLAQAELKVTQQSGLLASLRAQYNDAFNRYLHGGVSPHDHPVVAQAIHEEHCAICQSKGPLVSQNVRQRIEARLCPLCGSPLNPASSPDLAFQTELISIDERLAKAREALDEGTRAQERLQKEALAARSRVLVTRGALAAFENQDQDLADVLKGRHAVRTSPVAEALEGLKKAMSEFTAVRDAEYAERDRLREELKKLQRALELRYARAEEDFVPRFRNLAELFLGIDLDVALKATPPAGIKLIVEMRGNERRDENQMSESQRFFVDIALRMALGQQISDHACLFIDTPEGSLDIAYEERVGEMFARFAESGHAIVMTANINSSKLLTTLARRCGAKRMTINQMTGWTELSDVQQSATHLFQEAYQEIMAALEQGPAA